MCVGMSEKRFITDGGFRVLDTWFGYMGENEPTKREIKEKDYHVIGEAMTTDDADNFCKILNEQSEEIIHYCNFSLHDILDKKNKKINELQEQINTMKGGFDESNEIIGELEQENEQLKKENKEIKEKNERLFGDSDD